MNLDNTRKMIDKQKQQLSRIKNKVDSLEKQAREMEDENLIKIIRKDMTYDEFMKFWNNFRKEQAAVAERLKYSTDSEDLTKINTERTDVRSENEKYN